jgi:hypothetical protein
MSTLLGLALIVMITTSFICWVFILILIIKLIYDKYLTLK